ncbi:MAG: Nif3-like dinuclear metal center hexameric protein [Ruminococcaceae bacterium]|nr:Nif3-like dinuclear metal center hexameric protein [Oscillospiraceae bacterium]
MLTVKHIYKFLDRQMPFDSQEEWDNSGLLVGSPDKKVDKIAVMLDATPTNITKAINNNVDLIVCHHPIIFQPMRDLPADSAVYRLARNDIALIAVHTPWDKAKDGVNYALANALALERVEVFPTKECNGIVRFGYLPSPMPESAFCAKIKQSIGIPFVKYVSTKENVRKIAVCGGVGTDFIDEVAAKADAFVTSDVKYHQFLHAQDIGLTLIDAGHFTTEDISMNAISVKLAMEFAEAKVLRLKSVDPISYL